MASSSISGSNNPFGAIERTGGSGAVPKSSKANVERESMAADKGSEGREHFSASDSFYQRMETVINKEDVQSILDKQKETLTKFEKTNAKFGRFNDLSASRFLHLNQQLKNHTKMLLDMKKDLDSVFRRIRTVKAKLAKQYGPAFDAVSAGIQKLEEGLSASIENEDESSMEAFTEKHGSDHESQTSDHQLVDWEQSTNQDTKKDISRVDESAAMHSITSELRTSDDQSDDRTVTTFDLDHENETKRVEINEDYLGPENATLEKIEGFEIQDTSNGSLKSASIVQKDKDIISTAYSDEISRTIDTSDVFGPLDTKDTTGLEDTSKEDTSEIIKSVGTSDTSKTVDTTDPNGTVDTSDPSGTVDTTGLSGTEDTSGMTRSLDTSDTNKTVDTSGPSGTVDTSGMTRSLDTSDTNKTVDTSGLSGTVDTTGLSGTGDTSDPSATVDTSDLSRAVDTSDSSGTVDTSDPSRTVDTSDPCGKVDTTH